MINAFLFKRAAKIAVNPGPVRSENFGLVASFDANLRKLGYTLDGELALALMSAPNAETFAKVADEVIRAAKEVKGVRRYSPMYPNFPAQVMEASAAELWVNAIVHYWSGGNLFPDYVVEKRAELDFDESKFTRVSLANEDDVINLVASLYNSKSAWSNADKDDVLALFDRIDVVVRATRNVEWANRENKAFFLASAMTLGVNVSAKIDTATDVLRLAVGLSDGDVSLAEKTKFRNFRRPERRHLLSALNSVKNPVEDMRRHESEWKRLGEKLHPGEFSQFPNAQKAFDALRNEKGETFNARVEKAIAAGDSFTALSLLETRPGDFARRLNDLLQKFKGDSGKLQSIVLCFANVAEQASPTVLLQARNEFINYGKEFRTYFPKGSVNKMQVRENNRGTLPGWVLDSLAGIFDNALVKNFADREDLGGTWVDPSLKKVAIPFALRNAENVKTLGRGSRLSFDRDADTLRFFVWWKNGSGRTDVDLSAIALKDDFTKAFDITYYNLRGGGCVHSGDIVDAPNGASEFIDINLNAAREAGARYVAMSLYSFTGQPFADMGECFAGFMERSAPGSGEIYDPRTVANKTDLTPKAQNAVPFIFDLETGEAIWVDLSMSVNKVAANPYNSKDQARSVIEVMAKLTPPNLYDLFTLHGSARGGLVPRDEAKTVFAFDGGTDFGGNLVTPYDTEEILDKYL